MTAIEIAKLVAKITVMFGSGRIVNSAIKNNVTVNTLPQKFTVGVTSFILGGILTDITTNYTDRKIDEIDDVIHGRKAVSF